MSSVNKVILIGNLGADPELKATTGGKAVSTFSIATNESWKDSAGAKQERAEWHRVVVWNETAENCAKYLRKGRPVYVEGRIQSRKWQDKEGRDQYTTEIVAERVVFLGGKDDGAGRESRPAPATQSRIDRATSAPAQTSLDDLPF